MLVLHAQGGVEGTSAAVLVPPDTPVRALVIQVLLDVIDGERALASNCRASWTSAAQSGVVVSRTRLVTTTGSAPHDVVVAGDQIDVGHKAELRAASVELDPAADVGVDRISE